jgi:hypothetical protein
MSGNWDSTVLQRFRQCTLLEAVIIVLIDMLESGLIPLQMKLILRKDVDDWNGRPE